MGWGARAQLRGHIAQSSQQPRKHRRAIRPPGLASCSGPFRPHTVSCSGVWAAPVAPILDASVRWGEAAGSHFAVAGHLQSQNFNGAARCVSALVMQLLSLAGVFTFTHSVRTHIAAGAAQRPWQRASHTTPTRTAVGVPWPMGLQGLTQVPT